MAIILDPLQQRSLKLIMGNYTAEIIDREQGQNSRLRLQFTEVTYNHPGTPVLKGVSHKARYQWQSVTICDTLTRDILELMYDRSETARIARTDPVILLEDRVYPILEDGAATREMAHLTASQPIIDGVKYFAQFQVFMTKCEPREIHLNKWRVTLELKELDKVLAV